MLNSGWKCYLFFSRFITLNDLNIIEKIRIQVRHTWNLWQVASSLTINLQSGTVWMYPWDAIILARCAASSTNETGGRNYIRFKSSQLDHLLWDFGSKSFDLNFTFGSIAPLQLYQLALQYTEIDRNDIKTMIQGDWWEKEREGKERGRGINSGTNLQGWKSFNAKIMLQALKQAQ